MSVTGCPPGGALYDAAVAPSPPLRFPVDCTLRISSGAAALPCGFCLDTSIAANITVGAAAPFASFFRGGIKPIFGGIWR